MNFFLFVEKPCEHKNVEGFRLAAVNENLFH